MMSDHEPPTIIIDDNAFGMMRNVDFFLRIHRHLPDVYCGESGYPFGDCRYRADKIPINIKNDRLDELQKDSEFVQKEKEIAEAVKMRWSAHE